MSLFDPGGIKQNYENKSFRKCFRGTLRMSLRQNSILVWGRNLQKTWSKSRRNKQVAEVH